MKIDFSQKPKKSLGQNFLIDNNIIKKIIEIGEINNNSTVMEIGPGYGSLTELLVNKSPKIHMLDKDFTREDFLKKFPNARTFPQIIINGENIGGYHELEKWLGINSFEDKF